MVESERVICPNCLEYTGLEKKVIMSGGLMTDECGKCKRYYKIVRKPKMVYITEEY
jgi:hypothetical protein